MYVFNRFHAPPTLSPETPEVWYRYVIDEELIEEALPRSPPCDFSRFGFDLGAGDCLRIFGIWILFVRCHTAL